MYFKIFKPISWDKRPAERRSRFIQRFPRPAVFAAEGQAFLPSYAKPPGLVIARSTATWQSKEALNKSAAADSGSFVPTFRFENLEIHKVFLRFSNLNLEQNPSLTALADLFRASLIRKISYSPENIQEAKLFCEIATTPAGSRNDKTIVF